MHAESEVEGLGFAEADVAVEIGGETDQREAAEVLGHEDGAGDFGAAEVGAAEAFEVGEGGGGVAFEVVGVLHHGDDVVRVVGW